MDLLTLLSIMLGGIIGTTVRIILNRNLNGLSGSLWLGSFKGTFIANFTACLGLGFINGRLSLFQGYHASIISFLIIGVIGSLSTFSTLICEIADQKTAAGKSTRIRYLTVTLICAITIYQISYAFAKVI